MRRKSVPVVNGRKTAFFMETMIRKKGPYNSVLLTGRPRSRPWQDGWVPSR
jgi:hypothetical protein